MGDALFLYFLLFSDVDEDILLRLSVQTKELSCGHGDVGSSKDLLDVGDVLGFGDCLALQCHGWGLADLFPFF